MRSRGTIVAIGLPANAFLKAPVFNTVVRMITIKGSYVGNRQDGDEAIDFFARGLIKAPFKTVPLSELGKVYELMGSLIHFPYFQRGWIFLLTFWFRTRKDCRSVCVGDAKLSLALDHS